ncbi:MAG TPA: DUF192 domain-containing protein [Acidimicrobiia bacterium]|nr:DUF192 domain-containing protein [Acidimicrobiia bacterium]
MSNRLGIAIAIAFLVVVLTALSVWVLRDVVKNVEASVEIDGVDTSTAAVAPFAGLTEANVSVDGDCKRVAVADSLAERQEGLRGATDLTPYDGMLFVFASDSDSHFTMADTLVPLDIGWYSANGLPVDRTTMQPCPEGDDATCPDYGATSKYRYALETPAGQLGGGSLSGCSS